MHLQEICNFSNLIFVHIKSCIVHCKVLPEELFFTALSQLRIEVFLGCFS